MHYIYFSELPVGALFGFNGSKCKKQSTRTAAYTEHNNRWFFFGKNDLCTVSQYNRLASDYFV